VNRRWISFIILTMVAQTSAIGSANLEQKVDGLFEPFNRSNTPGAAIMVIRDGRPLLAKAYGLADLEARVPCATNTNFRLASVTKQFTAMAILLLAERKLLTLDQTLTDFFPEFPAYGRQITVRQLLNHTSGLLDYEDLIPRGTAIPVLDRDVLRLLLQQDKTIFAPGSKYQYSNSGYALLALIIEVCSRTSCAHFLRQNIFQPLGMINTVAYEQGLAIVPNRAFGYSAEGDHFKRTDQSLTSSVLGDGGIYSSITDLYKWDQALYTGKLINRRWLKQAFTAGPVTDHPGTGYGFGWYVGSYRGLKEIWHSGNTVGFTTRIARYPEQTFTVIILSNRQAADLAEIPHKLVDWCVFEANGKH